MFLPHFNADADEALVDVSGATGRVAWCTVENTDASATVYLQLFADPAAVVGTDPPVLSIPCAPGVSGFFFGEIGQTLGDAGVHYAVTAGATNATAPPSTVRVNMGCN